MPTTNGRPTRRIGSAPQRTGATARSTPHVCLCQLISSLNPSARTSASSRSSTCPGAHSRSRRVHNTFSSNRRNGSAGMNGEYVAPVVVPAWLESWRHLDDEAYERTKGQHRACISLACMARQRCGPPRRCIHGCAAEWERDCDCITEGALHRAVVRRLMERGAMQETDRQRGRTEEDGSRAAAADKNLLLPYASFCHPSVFFFHPKVISTHVSCLIKTLSVGGENYFLKVWIFIV